MAMRQVVMESASGTEMLARPVASVMISGLMYSLFAEIHSMSNHLAATFRKCRISTGTGSDAPSGLPTNRELRCPTLEERGRDQDFCRYREWCYLPLGARPPAFPTRRLQVQPR
jgi:hypothetical protein